MTIFRLLKKNKVPGFTLLEVLVTIVLIGLVMGLVVGQVNKMTGRNMKAAARKLSSTVRYLYNKAATEGVTLRLVISFEENKYWVEGTSQTFSLVRESEAPQKKEKSEKKEKEEASAAIEPVTPQFSPEESHLLKPVKLPKGVFFKDIYAEHQIDHLSEGKAYIYFFSQGYAERSIINLRDKTDEMHFSITVNPITGKTEIDNEYREAEIE